MSIKTVLIPGRMNLPKDLLPKERTHVLVELCDGDLKVGYYEDGVWWNTVNHEEFEEIVTGWAAMLRL